MNLARVSTAERSLLGACVSLPSGPSVLVLQGSGKSFDQFRYDDAGLPRIRQRAIGGTPLLRCGSEQRREERGVGTVVGAAAGAALAGRRCGRGAGAGLLIGSAAGRAGETSAVRASAALRYAYIQCMYSRAQGARVRPLMSSSTPLQLRSASTPPPPPPPQR